MVGRIKKPKQLSNQLEPEEDAEEDASGAPFFLDLTQNQSSPMMEAFRACGWQCQAHHWSLDAQGLNLAAKTANFAVAVVEDHSNDAAVDILLEELRSLQKSGAGSVRIANAESKRWRRPLEKQMQRSDAW